MAQIDILFTRGPSIGSHIIRGITGETVSHCAIRMDQAVMHASFTGVELVRFTDFQKSHEIVYTVSLDREKADIMSSYDRYKDCGYDYPALFFFPIRYMCVKLGIPSPKVNMFNSTGMMICTEFVSAEILGAADSMITPGQLYLKLKDME